MSTACDRIKRGLQQAIEHTEGCAPQARIRCPGPVTTACPLEEFTQRQSQIAQSHPAVH
ncbi:MAG TPA: hypothetical protein PLB25_09375 [Rhodoferax sp.]|nr:hypothetical protein [Rhodoferax sp.]